MPEHIGSQVNVPGTRGKGILRYHGSIHGKQGIFAGIELLGPIALTRGKNSGDVEGYKYFEVQQPLTGLFLPFERLKAVNPTIEFTRDMIHEVSLEFNNDSLDEEIPMFASPPTPKLRNNRPYSADVSKSRFSNQSPILMNKRQTQLSERSRTSSISSFSRSPILNANGNGPYRSTSFTETLSKRLSSGNYLEQELHDLRAKYEKSEREMLEKMQILNELKDTVQELQPILRQYENELDERDRKIAKIRNEFESAREDWRQNLDIMVSTYESNENYYESKIRELQKIVSEKSMFDDKSLELRLLKEKYDELIQQKIESENALQLQIKEIESRTVVEESKDLNKKISDQQKQIEEQQKEIESLSSQLVEIRQVPSEDPNAMEEKIMKLEAEIEALISFKARVGVLEQENSELQKELERRHSFEKLEDKNTELNKLRDTISDMKEQLAAKDKEIAELEDSLDSKVKQVSVSVGDDSKVKELEDDMFFKDQEIKALQQQLDKTSQTVATQKQKLKELQTQKSGISSDTPNDVVKSLEDKDRIIEELEQKLQKSLEKELDSMNITDAAAINELTFREEIDELKRQLAARPTIEELTELQDNIDEMVRLHNNEVFFKQEEIQRLANDNGKLQARLERALEGSIVNSRISDASHESISVNSLPIYKPEESDPSAGKDNWCGLCERDGHSSLNCPYENDIF